MTEMGSTTTAAEADSSRLYASLAAVVEAMPTIAAIVDDELRFVSVNALFAQLSGISPEAHPGRRMIDILPRESGIVMAANEVLSSGRARLGAEIEGQSPGTLGVVRTWRASCHPLALPDAKRAVLAVLEEVTPAAVMEAALRATETSHRELFEQSPTSTVLYDRDGRPIAVNPAFERLWNATLADVPGGYTVFDDPQLSAAGLIPLVRRAFAGEVVRTPPIAYTMPANTGEGRTLWTEGHFFPVRDRDGEVVQVVLSHEDVTVRIEVEQALQSSERRYRALVEAGTRFVWSSVSESSSSGSSKWSELTGLALDPSDSDSWLNAVHPADRERVKTEWQRAVESELPFDSEYRLILADGSVRRFRARGVPVPGERDAGVQWIGTLDDVEEERRAVDELMSARADAERAEQRLRDVFEQAPVAIAFARGAELIFEVANPTFQRLVPGRELIGLSVRETLADMGERLFEVLEEVYRSGEMFTGTELPLEYDRHNTGQMELGYFNVVFHPLRDARGSVDGVVCVAAEVTDLVLARREADRLRDEAESANRAKGQFLGTISHELRTPLNAISGYVELLELELRGPLTDLQRNDLSRVRRSAQHLLTLINDLLSFARLEAGQIDLRLEPVAMAAVLADLEPSVAPQIEAKQIRFDTLACDTGLRARADFERLRQVLLNLVGNAVKFTPDGGRIAVTCEPVDDEAGSWVRVSVTDTGIGVSSDQAERIFEPFVQVDRHATRQSQVGVGLGLAISRDLARRMGGDVTVESRTGEGSVFSVWLPRA